jgi:hypothetical protein
MELESQGYIIIASMDTLEAAQELERKCHGYVRALVLDPSEVREPFIANTCLT